MAVLDHKHHDVYPFIDPRGNLSNAASGKIVLIIGGNAGIGKKTAEAFALAGASTVIITGRRQALVNSTVSELQSVVPTCKIIGYASDISDPKAVEDLFAKLKDSGVPDVMVNNAGVANGAAKIGDSDPVGWWNDYEVNVKGIYLGSRAYIRALQGKPGVIINTSSVGAWRVMDGMSSYQSGKCAVNRITEFVDVEYADKGITTIAYHPGGILDSTIGQAAPAAIQPYLIDKAELSGATCVYLSTPRAKYLAGRYVEANWDMEVLEANKERIVKEDLLKAKMAAL